MKQKVVLTLICILIVFTSSTCRTSSAKKPTATRHQTTAIEHQRYIKPNEDKDIIRISHVSPSTVASGVETEFKVEVYYNLYSKDTGKVYIGFNTKEADSFHLVDGKQVRKGSGKVYFKCTVIPKNWGYDAKFEVYVNLAEYPHSGKSFTPLVNYTKVINVH
ncbi:MAG: hypothetical protein PVH61_32890 [Candidatus Aminicenantes bacterium]